MGLIKKPGELTPKTTISALIYGQPGAGKSTLACSAPNAVLFDYDGGINRINGAHQIPTVQITCWEETHEALAEIEREMPECQTIIIDTVGKMLDYMSAYIIKNDSKMAMRDGSLQLKGYGVRKTMFSNFIKQLAISGKNVIFVAHEREDKQGDVVVKRPEIGGSSAADLMKDIDIMGYIQLYGKDRVICFDPTETYQAKNSCNLPGVSKIPLIVDESGNAVGKNNFFENVINTFVANQQAKVAKRHEYDELIEAIGGTINESTTLEEINELVVKIPTMQHIFESKVVLGRMLNARAQALGFKLDRITKLYVAA
jgi:hypothetical protein